jgi:hypothetical protein
MKTKLADYIEAVKHPHCFQCNGMTVNVEFDSDGKSLEESLIKLFLGMKNR